MAIETVAMGLAAKGFGIGNTAKILPAAGAGVAILGGGIKCFTTVKPEHIAMRSRWDSFTRANGEYRNLVHPGKLKFAFPITNSIHAISMQDSNMNLPDFITNTKDNRQFEVAAQLTWGIARQADVCDELVEYGIDYKEVVYRALTRAREPMEMAQGVSGICTEGLRALTRDTESIYALNGRELQPGLVAMCGRELLTSYGVDIRRLSITNTAQTPADRVAEGIVAGSHILAAGATIPYQEPNL